MTLPSCIPLPARTQRTRPVRNNGKNFPLVLNCPTPYVPLSPRLMFIYLYLVLSHVRTAVTGIPSALQTCSPSSAPFPYNHDPCLSEDNTTTRLFKFPMSLFFTSKHAAQMPTGTDDDVPPNVELGTLLGRSGLEMREFISRMGGVEAVLSEQKCQCGFQWVGLSESVEAQDRRVLRQGMVWSGRERLDNP